jgi:hypothetical protein
MRVTGRGKTADALRVVMAGLVPAIYAVPWIISPGTPSKFGKALNFQTFARGALTFSGILRSHGVGGRDKPGHDVWWAPSKYARVA